MTVYGSDVSYKGTVSAALAGPCPVRFVLTRCADGTRLPRDADPPQVHALCAVRYCDSMHAMCGAAITCMRCTGLGTAITCMRYAVLSDNVWPMSATSFRQSWSSSGSSTTLALVLPLPYCQPYAVCCAIPGTHLAYGARLYAR